MVLRTDRKKKTVRELPNTTIRDARPILNATDPLFAITGVVHVTDIVGEVIILCGANATNVRLRYSTSILSGEEDIAGFAAGVLLGWDGIPVTGRLLGFTKRCNGMSNRGVYFRTGFLQLTADDANVGQIRWIIKWVRVEPQSMISPVYS